MTTFDPGAIPCPWGAAPSLIAEEALHAAGYLFVAGVDEVGRGCLAGPVVAGAVILPPEDAARTLEGVRDSKALTASQRARLAEQICATASGWAIGIGTIDDIAQVNILGATRRAMLAAIAQLSPAPTALLIDAVRLPMSPLPQVPLIKGDQRSRSIAAASIIAKVARDALMVELDTRYLGYGFAQHKGYGTPEHLRALRRLGPCAIHRRDFAPVKALLDPPPVQSALFAVTAERTAIPLEPGQSAHFAAPPARRSPPERGSR